MAPFDLGPLPKVLPRKEDRSLHRDVLAIRHKIVAHADSRYFPVRLVKNFMTDGPGRQHDFAISSGQTLPRLNLLRVRANASHLAAVFALHAHEAAQEVRTTRKRLHSK